MARSGRHEASVACVFALLLLRLAIPLKAQPITQHARALAVPSTLAALTPGRIPSTEPLLVDSVAHWSGRGQLGLHWTEGTTDVVLFTAQHDLFFQSSPYEAYASVSATASWTDIFGTDGNETQRVYRYALDLHGQRTLSKRTQAVTNTIWLSAPNQGIERQVYAGAGAALILSQHHRSSLRAQATGGYLHEREESNEQLDAPAASVALNLELRLADNGRLAFHAEAIDNLLEPEDLLLRVHGSLTAPLGKHIGLTVSVDMSHDLLPAGTYFEEDGNGELVSITPSAFSAFMSTGLSIQW